MQQRQYRNVVALPAALVAADEAAPEASETDLRLWQLHKLVAAPEAVCSSTQGS